MKFKTASLLALIGSILHVFIEMYYTILYFNPSALAIDITHYISKGLNLVGSIMIMVFFIILYTKQK